MVPRPAGPGLSRFDFLHQTLLEYHAARHDFWRRQGGYVNHGRYEETSCFPMLDVGTSSSPHLLRPVGIYPVSGTVEVVFQYLQSRAPFDDTEQRRELLNRLNEIGSVDLPEAKLELRPSCLVTFFAEHRRAPSDSFAGGTTCAER
ncbi:hypothetical protein [Streptomyces brasiliensis]|uniref:Uncharacterized protein n=1 Tax=Streptomyces brasiliensis TaxID=1954 RepID=A0A917PAQ5_9ACTN|nr:hypothetical protein [Streptomyces brasiliensis]GGJ68948.1 hypothetical protein GCM10010121_094590 [Streptomyces brasiliensis]